MDCFIDCAKEIEKFDILKFIGSVADELNLESYVVGGFVRDLMLERKSKDIDIVCLGSGIDLANAVANVHKNVSVSVFKTFGTAMLNLHGWEIEFVGARKESYNKSSRNPVVENGTLKEDQERRDFTINSLAICINASAWGRLVDPFSGCVDLSNKIIKTPLDPDITFYDDPLRMMRAIRFAVQLNMTIDSETLESITKNRDRIEIISKERITVELNKIISEPNPSRGFRLLDKTGILEIIFPEFVLLKDAETIGIHSHKDNFEHTLQVLDNVSRVSNNLWLRWAAILHDIAKPKTKRFDPIIGFTFHIHEELGARMVPHIFRKMRLPMNYNMTYVQKLVRMHLRPIALAKKEVTDSAIRRLIYDAGNAMEDLLSLCRADITSKNDEKISRYMRNFDLVESKIKLVEEKDHIKNLQPVITGKVIMETFNIAPSMVIGAIKIAIKEAILNGDIKNEYKEAYDLMLKLGEQKGLKIELE